MSKSEVIIPEEMEQVLTERARVWQAFDRSNANAAAIESHSVKVGPNASGINLPHLANLTNPPAEIYQALQQLKQELSKIDQARQSIQDKSNEIDQLKATIKNRYITLAVVLTIVILFVLMMISR